MIILKKIVYNIKNNILKYKNRSKNLEFGYNVILQNFTFGINVVVENNTFINSSVLNDYVRIKNNVSINNTIIDRFTYISSNCTISNTTIGSFCSIGPDCKFGLGIHPSNTFVSTSPLFYSKSSPFKISFSDKQFFNESKRIHIGNDVWIGSNVIILDGINISDGAIIGAGSVVTKDVEPYSIVGGVPAKIIKFRFDKLIIQYLLQYKWWNKELSWIKSNYMNFHKIEKFIDFTKKEKIEK